MSKEELSALLGRPLTPIENANFDTYLEIAFENLESLICVDLVGETETRVFGTRQDYKTAFTDIFYSVSEVKLDGDVVTEFTPMQWDRRSGSWFNSLVFDDYLKGKELEVTASWGFEPESGESSLPADLQLLVAGLFGLISKKNNYDSTIESKQVEDFRVSFRDTDLDQNFYDTYQKTISKYSICDIPNVRHGKTCSKCRLDCEC